MKKVQSLQLRAKDLDERKNQSINLFLEEEKKLSADIQEKKAELIESERELNEKNGQVQVLKAIIDEWKIELEKNNIKLDVLITEYNNEVF